MDTYPKIQTIFKRDPETSYSTLLMGEWSKPEFEYLARNKWVFREKIHGTNLRLTYTPGPGFPLELYGRRESSQVPDFLVEAILGKEEDHSRRHDLVARFEDKFGMNEVCLYGEGFGYKIQKEGEYYLPHSHDFCVFDVSINGWWLEEEAVTEIAETLGFTRAPIIGTGTLHDAVSVCESGFYSRLTDTPLIAEGLIMHPKIELKTREGKRVMAKLKHEDFEGNSMMKFVPDDNE